MNCNRPLWALSTAMTIGLAGCGGGGEGTNFIPSPPSAPTATAAPPAFNLASSQDFVMYTAMPDRDNGPYQVDPITPNAVAFRWDQQAGVYQMTIPGFAPSHLEQRFASNPIAFKAIDANGSELPIDVDLYTDDDLAALSYTATGVYETWPSGATNPNVYARFAFGIPTAASSIPMSGTATYDAQVVGFAAGLDITGDASLSFDFGKGSLTGYMDPKLFSDWGGIDRPIGRYDFTQTLYAAGSNAFSGKFTIPSGTPGQIGGAFDGRFTGPTGSELLAGWTAPYLDPFDNTWKSMSGLWTGKKQ